MGSNINPINVNPQGIGNNYGFEPKAKQEEKKAEEKEVKAEVQQKSVPAEDILGFMAQSAIAVMPVATKAVDPAKYVDKESEARIADFMAQFEDIVAKNLEAIDKEFPQMSEGAKQALALAQVGE